MKKLLIILSFIGFSAFGQTPNSTQKGYYLQMIGDSVVGQNTRPDKAFFDLYNYMKERKIKNGTVTSPYWEITVDYSDMTSGTTDTIYIDNTIPSNPWMGEPISITKPILRINAGGNLVKDTPLDWQKDVTNTLFTKTGTSISTYTKPVTKGNTIPETISDGVFNELFKTEVWNNVSKPSSYDIPLPNGYYEVDFFMVSQYANTTLPGTRIFSILLEGMVKDTIDINERFGTLTAGVVSFGIDVTDGVLNISFENIKENALVNAIQIRK